MQDSHENQSSGSGLAPFIIFGLGALVGYQMNQSKNRSAQFATEVEDMDTPVTPEVTTPDEKGDIGRDGETDEKMEAKSGKSDTEKREEEDRKKDGRNRKDEDKPDKD